mgnify:CR=1 FL=1
MDQQPLTSKQIINNIVKNALDEIEQKTGVIMDARINSRMVRFYTETDNNTLNPFTLSDIEQAIIESLSLQSKPNILRSKNRKRDIVDLRSIFSHISRRFQFTVKNIGLHMGRDHTTAVHHYQKAEDLLKTDPLFVEKYKRVINNLKSKYAEIVY